MDGGTGPGAEVLSPAEAEWPPELRLPPLPPMPARHGPAPQLPLRKEPLSPRHAEGFDDNHFLGSIMRAAAQPQPQQAVAAEAPVKRKRGRPPKNRDGAAPTAPPRSPAKKKDEEVVCFICFDGGSLVVCDRRACPKVYHPACVKRDEAFFRARGKWDCGWHICSICEKAAQYMCFTCTYALCKGCIGRGNFFGVRANKGFCDTCYSTILLIESKDEGGSKIRVDFDDKNSWEYLFKLYWLDQKGKNLLTLEELISAKSRWTVPTTAFRKEREESSDESYDANSDQDATFDISLKKRRQSNSSGKRGRKRQKDVGTTARKDEISFKGYESLPNRLPTEGMVLQGDTKWASPEMLEFIGHVRNGDSSYISQYDVQVLLLEYIKQNNLRDPRKKSQIICDARLSKLFRKPRVAHIEMLKLLEMHFHVKDNPDSAQSVSAKRRKIHMKIEKELTANPEDYAAIDMHNISLIYLRRSLLEDLIDDKAAFSDKIAGAFVRIRISGLGQKQDMYRLVKVLGTQKVAERYSVGRKTTDYALEILNLDKKEVITMDTISNQDFTEEECKRLRQSMKFGLVAQLKVGDIYEKAKIFQSLQLNDWLENEKQRLTHLRDRASETGRRKELRQCVEKLQLLNTHEERARKINEVPEVHVDHRMAPDYESAEEQYYKKAADSTINRSGSDLLFPQIKVTQSNSVKNHTQKSNLNNTTVETASLPSSGAVLNDSEPEKVWHYKDPSGNVQGPFTLLQLSNWASYFPSDLRIWLTFESEKNSLLLTEVLKQQKDFVLPSAATTGDKSVGKVTGQDRTNSGLVANNTFSPIGYNVVPSSGLSCHTIEFSDPTKEGSTVLCGTLPSRSPNEAHNLHGQVQHQVSYSCTIPSLTAPGSHDERVPREQVGEWKNHQDIGGMWSPTVSSMNHSSKSNVEPHPHPDVHTMKDHLQNDSAGILPAGSVESFNSRIDSGLQKVSVLPAQQSRTDPAASLPIKTPSEFICKEEDTCWRSATNDTHDDQQLSSALAKQEIRLPTNPVEDRDSSSASGVPNRLGAPACLPQVQSMSTTNSSNTATINQQNRALTDASSNPFDQHSELNDDPAFSSDTHQDRECEYPSPAPRLEMKQTCMNQSGSTSVRPKDSGTKTCVHSSISVVSESSSPPVVRTGSLQSLNQTSCLEERHSSGRDATAQKEQLNEGDTTVKRNNIVINPISVAEGIAVSHVLESLTEKNCQKSNLLGAESLENFVPASTEEEQPQCSSPIALSPWGEQNYYQGEAVDSALWGVQDDQSNDMWPMQSPTPALQPSSGLGANGKDASRIIEEVMAARENTFVETLLKQGEKKMEQGNSSASKGSRALEEVKTKPSSVEGPSLDGTTNAADCQSSGTALERSAKASGWKPSGLLLEGIAKASDWLPSDISKASDWQLSNISKESGSKDSSWQPSDSSLGGGTKASGWGQINSSAEEGAKASGWPRPSSFPDGSRKGSTEGSLKASGRQQSIVSPEGNRKASGWGQSNSSTQEGANASSSFPDGSIKGSTEGSVKASGWQQSSVSPEGSRKASGWGQSNSSTQEGANASGWQRSSSFPDGSRKSSTEGSVKASGWQQSSVSPEGSRKASGWEQSNSSTEEGANASGWQRSSSFPDGSRTGSTEGSVKASGCQQSSVSLWGQSNSSTEEGAKASGWQRSRSFPDGSRKGSTEGSVKASGRQQPSVSPEGSRKASGCQWLGSSAQGNTKASGCQASGSFAERSAKVDGWQRTSSSPDGSRKASGWHQSVRESSRAISTSGSNGNNKLSSSNQSTTPTAKNLWDAPVRQGNCDKNTVSWGEALGNNRSWNTSSGNASRGSQGGHNHDRYLHGSDPRWGSSSHSRWSDHRQDHDHRGSSRSLSRGQSPRGVCKYHEKGHCFKGNKCQYLHR